MKNEVVGSMSDWSGVLKDLFRQIGDGSITLPQLQAVLERKVLSDIDWSRVYTELGMSAEYAEFAKTLSVQAGSNLWREPVIKGATCNKAVAALRKLGVNVYVYTEDLDGNVPTNDRDPSKGSYTIGFARAVEADEANKGLSAKALAKAGHKGITLLERLLLELGYFLATNQHLDVKNITLCAGSRDSDGGFPFVDWGSVSRKVYVRWCSPGHCSDCIRSRSVVSS